MPPEDEAGATLSVRAATEAPAAAAPVAAAALAPNTATVTDLKGRVLTVRKLNALLKMDLSRIVGAEDVKNEGVIGPASMAFSVIAIDGETIPPPMNYDQLRALVARLDDEGIDAAQKCVMENWPQLMANADTVKNS